MVTSGLNPETIYKYRQVSILPMVRPGREHEAVELNTELLRPDH